VQLEPVIDDKYLKTRAESERTIHDHYIPVSSNPTRNQTCYGRFARAELELVNPNVQAQDWNDVPCPVVGALMILPTTSCPSSNSKSLSSLSSAPFLRFLGGFFCEANFFLGGVLLGLDLLAGKSSSSIASLSSAFASSSSESFKDVFASILSSNSEDSSSFLRFEDVSWTLPVRARVGDMITCKSYKISDAHRRHPEITCATDEFDPNSEHLSLD
jgi:hypothetical protein